MLSKQQAISKMNQWGRDRAPFLFIIDFSMERPLVFPLDEISPGEILYNIRGIKNYGLPEVQDTPLILEKYPVAFASYENAFEQVKRHIHYGNSYLVNLTQPTRIKINYSLKEIFYYSEAKYKLWYKDDFVVFSPEIFVEIIEGKIASYPMKGTIDAQLPGARERILSDPKEYAEHATIVDLIRNDLSGVARDVNVENFRYIDHIKTNQKDLLQVSSKITGLLGGDYRSELGDILFTLLPAGSVTGAPKSKTVEIIREAEGYQRGYYTGVFGVFDGTNLDSAVMIRFIEKKDTGFLYKSGGGITFQSKVKEEYDELIQKVYVPVH